MIPSDLDPTRITERLRTARLGRSLDVRRETGSTNDDARAAAAEGAPDGHVVLADRQRQGRGAGGTRWLSPGGTDLYLSIVSRIDIAPARLPPLTLAVGLGVARAVIALAPGARVEIKWPNDVLLDDAKCAGVLVESVIVGPRVETAIIGIGLDVNRVDFEPELAGIATSLARARGAGLDRADVVAALLGEVERAIDAFVAHGPGPTVHAVEALLAWRGVNVHCGDAIGVVRGLREDGALLLEGSAGPIVVRSGPLRRA